jgi:hypothetical protein
MWRSKSRSPVRFVSRASHGAATCLVTLETRSGQMPMILLLILRNADVSGMLRLAEHGLGIAFLSDSFDRRSMALRTVARFIL